MGYAEIIAAAIAAIGALISAGKETEAQNLRQRLADEYGPEILPDLDKAVAQQAPDSVLGSTPENDQARRQQMDVLAQLDNEYQSGGTTAADEAAYDQARRKVAQQAGSRASGLNMEAARRGQANGPLGAVLASQSGQDELEALASLDADVASAGRGRALQALGMKGNLASGVRGDDWRALEARGSATDTMNRFNASQRMAAEMRNANIPQQEFDNNMARLAGLGAAQNGVAAGLEQQGTNARTTAAGMGNAALSYGTAWDWGEKKKKHDDANGDHG